MYFYECQHCGASIDPGETCDCMKEKAEQTTKSEHTPIFKFGKENAHETVAAHA